MATTTAEAEIESAVVVATVDAKWAGLPTVDESTFRESGARSKVGSGAPFVGEFVKDIGAADGQPDRISEVIGHGQVDERFRAPCFFSASKAFAGNFAVPIDGHVGCPRAPVIGAD